MKKYLKVALLTVLSVLLVFAFTACDPDTSEVAGTYEMTEVSGKINGVTIKKEYYDYFRIILDERGNGVVQSKSGGVAYEAKGRFTYSDGVIRMTSKQGSVSATEEYQYADGVITYSVSSVQMSFTIVLERVED